MSHYKSQEYDFINRTKKIIEQYQKMKYSKSEKFEVTLLLNCLAGLLILPQQNWFDSLPDVFVNQEEWGIKEEHISFIKKGEVKKVKNIAKQLRNSISHCKFKAFENKSKDISIFKFEDYDSRRNKTFEASIPISLIKQIWN